MLCEILFKTVTQEHNKLKVVVSVLLGARSFIII